MRTALTIAGSDSSGGAGIQADIKTMTANGVFAMSAITALTAQNTTGVTGIMEVSPEFLKQQIDSIFTDIRPDAVKIGMVSSGELIMATAEKLEQYRAEKIVIDPVMVATSAPADGGHDHSEYPGGGSTVRNEDPHRGGYGASCRKYQQQISVRGSGKGRTPAE